MSQRKESTSDTFAEDFLGVIFGILWFITAGLFGFVIKWFRVPLEKQLQGVGDLSVWGSQIEAISCSQCTTLNEHWHTNCFTCGAVLTTASTTKRESIPTIGSYDKVRLKFIATMLLFIVGSILLSYLLLGLAVLIIDLL